MRKRICAIAGFTMLVMFSNVVNAETEKEILFRDIPWGTSFTEATHYFEGFDFWPLSGDWTINPSVDAVLLNDDYKGIDFAYSDINIIGHLYPSELEVAGYKTTSVELHFAYVLEDGALPKTEDASALYGATYIFEPMNTDEMTEDLINKLSSVYGEYEKESFDRDWTGGTYKYYYWYGANDSELVLVSEKVSDSMAELLSDSIAISYGWRKGDELLQLANDYLANEDINSEANSYGNTDTNGL